MRPKYSAVRVMHTNRSADLSRFDWFLAQCKAVGVRVIPCFTDMLGGCGDPDGDYDAHTTWIQSGAYNGVFKSWVQTFVTRYKGDPGILCYETINEVDADVGVAATKAFYDAIGGAIHTIDPGALVVGPGRLPQRRVVGRHRHRRRP
jgi:endo-1,4-beta-mannosidase